MMSSVARGGQRVARAVHVAAAAAPPTAKRVPAAARRNMGGHARHIGLPGEHVPIHVGQLHKNLGTVYLTTMFLWMMYRAKQDGLVLLGFEHPWDHMHEHGDGHDEPVIYHFTKMDDGDDEEEEEEEEEEAEEEEEEEEEE